MLNLTRAAIFTASFLTLPAFAQTDVADCKISGGEILATYHLDTKVMDVTITHAGKTQTMTGMTYQTFTHDQIASDENMTGLVQFAQIPLDKVDTGAGFKISEDSDGGLWLMKFVDSQGQVLRTVGAAGMSPFVCQ